MEARCHAWYRPGSRCAIRRSTASGRNGVAPEMARRMPALAAPPGSRRPARMNPEARRSAKRSRTTAARTRTRRSSFASESSNCCRSCSIGSRLTTGRGPRRVQLETVDRGMATCLGRHLVPLRITCSRRRWSYAWRVRGVAMGVFIITRTAPPGTQPPAKTRTILGVPMLRTRKRGMSAHAAGRLPHAAGMGRVRASLPDVNYIHTLGRCNCRPAASPHLVPV